MSDGNGRRSPSKDAQDAARPYVTLREDVGPRHAALSTPENRVIGGVQLVSALTSILGSNFICFKGAYVPKHSKQGVSGPHRTALHVDYGILEREGVNGGKISCHWGGVKPGQLGAIADMQRGPIGPLCMSAAK